MDIHLTGPFAQRTAEQANGQIFGDDIAAGPRRPTPEWLKPYVDSIGFYPAFIEIRPPEAPPGEPVNLPVTWRLFTHRVNLIADGRKVGEALRMDDVSLGVLEAFERQLRRLGGAL